ncbi:Inactive dipeptidyl peptidase 10, partial [Cichlidogyrus casuarinus]
YTHEGRAADHISAMTWIHRPQYDISDIYLKNGNDIFYQSSGPDPMEMHLFWFNEKFHNIDEAVCLSCNDSNCLYNLFLVAPNAKYVQRMCHGPGIFRATIYELKRTKETQDSYSYKLEFVKHLHELPEDRDEFKKFKMPRVEFHKIVLRANTSNQLTVNAKTYKPDWRDYMATRLSTIVIMIDGRGTGGRGRAFETSIYKHLGDYEISDQLEAVKVFAQNNKFVNQSQIGAFGWSYGGFTVGHLLGHPRNDIIRCGVSVAPVTNFKLYDTAYTERYLGLYLQNTDKYEKTNILPLVENMKGKSYFLIHGTADENVHLTNSALLLKELVRYNIDFDVM